MAQKIDHIGDSNKMVTAVEWFADEILKAAIVFLYNEKNEGKFSLAYDELTEKAKQMEKEQHGTTWLDSTMQFDNAAEMTYKKDFEQYYNEKYGTANGS